MKKCNRIIAVLLIALMLIPTFIACANDNTANTPDDTTVNPSSPTETTTAPAGADSTETEPAETDRADIKDNLPADLDLGGKTITVLTRSGNYRELDIDGSGQETGDVLKDAVYNRTRTVEERLHFTLNVIENSEGYKQTGTQVLNAVMSGDDTYQIVSCSCNGTMGASLDYIFQSVEDAKYLDFDQPWWWKDAILEGSMDGKTIRYFFGDANLTSYNYSGAILFNKTLYEKGIGSSEELYQLVLDRKWTWDKLGEYAQQLGHDLNGNDTIELEDLHGLYLDTKEYIKFFEYATTLRRYTRDADGFPVVDYDVDHATAIVEKLYSLIYETPGVYWDSAEKSRRRDVFANGNVVFYATLLGDAYNSTVREMSNPYGIVPYPMFDEAQGEYSTFIHGSSATFAIPTTNTDLDSTSAVLEALCAESYRSVIQVYFETCLKAKYSSDSQSAQCVDIIRNVSKKYLLDNYGSQTGNSGTMITEIIAAGSTNFASSYAGKAKVANRQLQELVKTLKYTD